MCESGAGPRTVREAEREFAKALRDEVLRLKRQIAEREAADALYFADIEVTKGIVVFYEPKRETASEAGTSEAAKEI